MLSVRKFRLKGECDGGRKKARLRNHCRDSGGTPSKDHGRSARQPPESRTESLVASAVQWAERIMKRIDGTFANSADDKRWPQA